ncbi:hypothetical protein AALO_G00021780 [Alosa alosa]|uniref:Transcription factor n=1 Tax=Alosa alosa TaxID=278164 RepID=A0AAV6HA71_9TELE|nr:hypothetical protein AALO_G00021780 [Alosa alosa]
MRVQRNSWREIAQTLGKDEQACRQRWKVLRDKFVKAKKKAKGRSGGAGDRVSRAPVLAQLGWLSSCVKHRHTESNVPPLNDSVTLDTSTLDTTLETTLDPGLSIASSIPPSPGADVEPVSSPLTQSTDTDSPAPASSSPCQPAAAATTAHRKKRRREPPMSAVQVALTKRLERLDASMLNEEKSFTDDIGKTLSRMPLVTRGQCKIELMLLVQKWFEQCQLEPAEQ